MSPELWSTIFAGGTFVVIAATAIAALIQLRHLRASNQLNALLTLMQMWNQPELQERMAYLRGALQQKIKEPSFLAELRELPISRAQHPEIQVADFWEQIGGFMKYNLVDERSWLDVAAPQVAASWDLIEPAIEEIRRVGGPAVYENFEYAAVRARLWLDRNPEGNYPPGTARMSQLKAAKRARAPVR